MALSSLEEKAIAILDVMDKRREKYDALNEQIMGLMGDFPTHIEHLDSEIQDAVIALVDEIVGQDKLAEYYLHECVGRLGHGGGIKCCEADPWRLTNADDLRKYVAHAKVCPGVKAA